MKRSQIGIILALVVLCFAFVASIFYFSSSKPENDLETVRVQLKWLHQSQFAGFYAADVLGFYKEQGIKVELIPGGPYASAPESLENDEVEFAVMGGFDLLQAIDDGQDIKAVLVVYQTTPTIFMSPVGRGVNKIEDFVGRKIGIQQSEQQMLYKSMMKNKGLDCTTMTEVPASYDLTQVMAGEFDIMPGYVINEYLTAMENDIEINIFSPSDYGVDVYGDVIAVTNDMIENNPDLIRRFIVATEQGWEYVIDHPEKAPEFVGRYNPNADIEHELLMMTESLNLLLPPGSHFGHMRADVWHAMSDMLAENGMIEASINAENVFDTQFMSLKNHK